MENFVPKLLIKVLKIGNKKKTSQVHYIEQYFKKLIELSKNVESIVSYHVDCEEKNGIFFYLFKGPIKLV